MKVSLKVLLMLAIVTSSTPSHAQLGDLFRKLGDAVDSVVKKIETSNEETKSESITTETDESKKIVSTEDESKKIVSTEQKNTTSKSNFDPNTLSVDEIKLYVVGKWGSCNDSTIKNGSYIFLDEKKQLNQEFYRDGNLIVSTVSSIEKIKINNKNLVRLTGRIFQYQSEFYKQTKKSRPIQTVWDIGVQDSIRVVQRTIWESPEIWAGGGGPRSEEIKDGRLSNGNQVSAIERCQVISENKKDTNLTNSDGNNNFGIKGFVLGGALPKNLKLNSTNTKRLDDGNLVTTVFFDTTILEVPFLGMATLLNDKIASVAFFDKILDQEFSKKEEYTDYFKRTRKLGPLTSFDFSKVSNDLVVLINSSLGNPKGQPKITKKVIDKPIAGVCYQYALAKMINNNSDKGFEGLGTTCNYIQNLVEGQCRNCKSTSYEFAWKSKTTDVFVQTIVPESKDMPYAMNYLQITYQDIELQRLLKQISDKQNIQAETQKKKLLDDAKQRELQMNRERDDRRKKDF
jgi:hypothetical protein